jgi:hypothetical protein
MDFFFSVGVGTLVFFGFGIGTLVFGFSIAMPFFSFSEVPRFSASEVEY